MSFSLDMIMRNVEVRAGVPAFIDSFISSVNDSLRLIKALLRENVSISCRSRRTPGSIAYTPARRRCQRRRCWSPLHTSP
jgi:hypothetical protein